MKKKDTKLVIEWSTSSKKNREKIRGNIPSQQELLSGGDSRVCRSPCPCKCDDYY